MIRLMLSIFIPKQVTNMNSILNNFFEIHKYSLAQMKRIIQEKNA